MEIIIVKDPKDLIGPTINDLDLQWKNAGVFFDGKELEVEGITVYGSFPGGNINEMNLACKVIRRVPRKLKKKSRYA